MGSSLPKPVDAVYVERYKAESFTVGVAEMNGWRNSMEDDHLCFMRKEVGYFGVFDGHGGDACSKFVAPRMHEILEAEGVPKDEAEAKSLIVRVDQEFLDKQLPSGSTATMCIVRPDAAGKGKHKLHVINSGDSRVMLGRINGDIVDGGGTDSGLTVDHKPDHPDEEARITRCGGTVEIASGGVARVNGDLAVSRGFGDADYKKTGGPAPDDRPVTCVPEQGQFTCDATDFLMLVCDGVSEGSFPNPEVVQLAAKVLRETGDAAAASRAVIRKAIEENSKDNISCMIVTFQGGAASKTTEFNPCSLESVSNKGYLEAYEAMAQKAGLDMAEVAEMRYDFVEAELRGGNVTGEKLQEMQSELQSYADAPAAGSAGRKAYFQKWLEDKKKESDGGGASEPGAAQMAQLMAMMKMQNEQPFGDSADEPRVTAAPLAELKAAVDRHPALKWDDRMEKLAGQEGHIKTRDDSDSTSQVRFPGPGMLAWLPDEALT